MQGKQYLNPGITKGLKNDELLRDAGRIPSTANGSTSRGSRSRQVDRHRKVQPLCQWGTRPWSHREAMSSVEVWSRAETDEAGELDAAEKLAVGPPQLFLGPRGRGCCGIYPFRRSTEISFLRRCDFGVRRIARVRREPWLPERVSGSARIGKTCAPLLPGSGAWTANCLLFLSLGEKTEQVFVCARHRNPAGSRRGHFLIRCSASRRPNAGGPLVVRRSRIQAHPPSREQTSFRSIGVTAIAIDCSLYSSASAYEFRHQSDSKLERET